MWIHYLFKCLKLIRALKVGANLKVKKWQHISIYEASFLKNNNGWRERLLQHEILELTWEEKTGDTIFYV